MRKVVLEKKKLRCLRCGKTIVTDIAHRFCRKCQRANRESFAKRQFRSPVL